MRAGLLRAASATGCAVGLARWLLATTLVATTASAAQVDEGTLGARLAGLDCSRLSGSDVAEVLSRSPAPRIIALQGSVPLVTMEPFAAFLEAMGYPRERLENPADRSTTYSSHVDSRRLAGEIAWHYEREGLMPIPIGHSQGGMIVIKLLHDLAGTRDSTPIPVWNPAAHEPETRTAIVDPLTGATRPVRELTINYAAALATGSLPRLLLGQWGILPLLRDVPDSAIEFTGFAIPWDPIAGTGAHPAEFRATGRARVRNVILPWSYSHVRLPDAAHLAGQPLVRTWIENYRPGIELPALPEGDTANLLHAADIWYSVKRQWCEGARALAATRGTRASR